MVSYVRVPGLLMMYELGPDLLARRVSNINAPDLHCTSACMLLVCNVVLRQQLSFFAPQTQTHYGRFSSNLPSAIQLHKPILKSAPLDVT